MQLLLPKNINNYFQYDGSLTTPPCNEAVKWIILTQTGEISRAQVYYMTYCTDILYCNKTTVY